MKVYVVMSGCVGDYHIVNIFSSIALAEKYIILHKAELYEPCIEPWEVYNSRTNLKKIKNWEGGES